MRNQSKGRHGSPEPFRDSCLLSLLASLAFVVFLLLCLPIYVPLLCCDKYLLHRLYRRENRVLRWGQVQQFLGSGKGTFVVEVFPPGGPGHVWYVDEPVLARQDCPLAPAKILLPLYDGPEGWLLLHAETARAWWDAHVQDFVERVSLVQMPSRYQRRQWNEVLSATNALAVDGCWTLNFYRHRFYLWGLRLPT
jgi:hypothetical protein